MSGDLDSILNGTEQPAQEHETPETPEAQPAAEVETPEAVAEEPKGPARDDKGRFAPKGETTGESPAPEKPEPALDHAALLGERRRRQEAEARMQQLEQQIAQFQQQQKPQPPVEAIDDDLMFTDPARYRQMVAAEIRRELQQEAQGWTQQSAIQARIDVSEMLARKAHADYDEKLEAFSTMARDNPALIAEMQRSHDPAEFAYQKAASWMVLQEVGSLDALKDRIRAELMAELQPAKPEPIIPETLADAPASRASASGVVHAPPSLDAILGR